MVRIELAPEVLDDFERFLGHMLSAGVGDVPQRMAQIMDGLQILAQHPLIGRKGPGGKRELVIGQGARGYVALYQFLPDLGTVFVLSVRSQREAGYSGGFGP